VRCTTVLEASMWLWSTRPRRPLAKGRPSRLRPCGGVFLQKNRYVDGERTAVVRALMWFIWSFMIFLRKKSIFDHLTIA
jgi:hypothetical protein